jgi:hypothetical protein
MRKDSLAGQLDGIEFTRNKSKPAVGIKADAGAVRMFSSGLSNDVQQRAFDAVPNEFRKAFDYRRLEWTVLAWVYRIDDHTICRAEVGVSARSPEDRNPHDPGYSWAQTWEMTQEQSYQRNAEETCKADVVVSAIESALKEPWDEHGVLDGFDVTREDGVPLVVAPKRPKTPAAPPATHPATPKAAAPDRFGKCQPPGGKVVRYTDRCTNGDCTRSFENGCSVRFQAPYCYDIASGQWTWKPDGC